MDNIISIITTLAKSNTINFIIMVGILYLIVKKMNLIASLNKSIEEVRSSIRQSENDKQNSQNILKNANETMRKLPKQIADIEKFNEQKIEVFKTQLVSSSQKTIDNINRNIENVIKIEEKKISNEVISETVLDSIEQSKKNLLEMLKVKPEMHYKFIEKSLDEFDRINL